MMITNEEDLAAALGENDPPVTNKQRMDYNAYILWLQKRGMAGKPELDKNNLGKNLLAKYIKENPSTTLTTNIAPIQKDLSSYRQWVIDNIKQGKGEYAPGTNESNFMQELSIVDNYPGQYTTRHSYPLSYLQTLEDGKVIKTENKGIINTANPVIPK